MQMKILQIISMIICYAIIILHHQLQLAPPRLLLDSIQTGLSFILQGPKTRLTERSPFQTCFTSNTDSSDQRKRTGSTSTAMQAAC
ncbi:hypothetical protein T11_11656 [Trichinella zimbabwensis]|uniref:Uncharacterized protein n=1 Tax=Trichinella zimbabwensis TaxID=268475 RepID=A0A0V1I0D4_9BILA|nr:hypothetical protein T11_11656 [Trichinella zimbabwensis]